MKSLGCQHEVMYWRIIQVDLDSFALMSTLRDSWPTHNTQMHVLVGRDVNAAYWHWLLKMKHKGNSSRVGPT